MITPGTFIADRYEVIDKVGAGGMSDVYKAKDHILGREVAIKILKQEFSEDATFVAKFRTEAQSAAGLEHPNIVNIYDVGSENGMYFIVMEYVEGITLKTYIEKKGQLNSKEAISIAIQVGRGIEAAHLKGIIHRDIKPQNIIISTEGKVKVTDFGIARAASSNTIHADVMGSVHYSSPEQARNGFVDGKSDIYSLGIVMYEMVTGRVPFDGDSTVAIAIQHLQEEMVAPSAYAPELPISLEKIILKATMKSPDRRYATISDMLMDLKKSLVSPDEDFVTIADAGIEKTRVVSAKEQEAITRKAAAALSRDIEEEVYDDDDDNKVYDDDDEDDEDGENMDKIMTIGGIAIGIAIVVILVVILGNVFGLFSKKSDTTVEMIDVVGEDYDDAMSDLYDLGLTDENITVVYSEDTVYADGIVADQSVEEDEDFDTATDTLELTVAGEDPEKSSDSEEEEDDSSDSKDDSSKSDSSDSTESVTVPTLVGLTEADAKAAIEKAGLNLTSESSENSDTVTEGCVISSSPAGGKTVDKGSDITIVLSKGSGTITYKFTWTNNTGYDGVEVTLPDGSTKTVDNGSTIAFTMDNQPTCSITIAYTKLVHKTDDDGNETDEMVVDSKETKENIALTGAAQ